jgi:hypothetical protein
MNPTRNALWILLGAVLPLALPDCASAMDAVTRYEPTWDSARLGQLVPAESPVRAEKFIDGAACSLQQAALRSDFASNERVLVLLQSAHDDLARVTGPLWRTRRPRVDQLLSGIDRAIGRATAPQAPSALAGIDSVGPQPPSRAELTDLARAVRALEPRSTSANPRFQAGAFMPHYICTNVSGRPAT